MIKIKIEKIQMPDGKFMVRFFPEPGIACTKGIDLSREKDGVKLYLISDLAQHNESASSKHTTETVDAYIKRVMTDIAEALKEDGLAAEADVEKVKGILVPFPVPVLGNTISEN